MERLSIIFRLLAAWLLLSTMVDLSRAVGTRLAVLTAPQSAVELPRSVQTRRTMMERLALAKVHAQSNRTVGEQLLINVLKDARDPQIRDHAAMALLELAVNDWPRGYRQEFLATIVPSALESAVTHALPPSIILSQAILESGWGRSQLAKKHHNLFGIKAGKTQNSVTLPTLEVTRKGVAIRQANFRRFESAQDSIAQHGKLLGADPRYASAREHPENWRQFLADLAPVYASEPQYAGHITQLIDTYALDRWDDLSVSRGNTHLQS